METAAVARKPGIWTQHVDPASGRAFYFNMALGRSYWELPEHLLAQVQQPRIDELRRWDPEAVKDKYGGDSSRDDELKRRREEAIAKAKQQEEEEQEKAERDLSLQERMALAAQRKKQEEIEAKKAADASAAGAQQVEGSAQSSEYLEMVRKLQHVDRDTEETGGKWLVR